MRPSVFLPLLGVCFAAQLQVVVAPEPATAWPPDYPAKAFAEAVRSDPAQLHTALRICYEGLITSSVDGIWNRSFVVDSGNVLDESRSAVRESAAAAVGRPAAGAAQTSLYSRLLRLARDDADALQLLSCLVDSGVIELSAQTDGGAGLLHAAVGRKRMKLVHSLLASGSRVPLTYRDPLSLNSTIVHAAISNKLLVLSIVRSLLRVHHDKQMPRLDEHSSGSDSRGDTARARGPLSESAAPTVASARDQAFAYAKQLASLVSLVKKHLERADAKRMTRAFRSLLVESGVVRVGVDGSLHKRRLTDDGDEGDADGGYRSNAVADGQGRDSSRGSISSSGRDTGVALLRTVEVRHVATIADYVSLYLLQITLDAVRMRRHNVAGNEHDPEPRLPPSSRSTVSDTRFRRGSKRSSKGVVAAAEPAQPQSLSGSAIPVHRMLSEADATGRTALHIAAAIGNAAAIRLMVHEMRGALMVGDSQRHGGNAAAAASAVPAAADDDDDDGNSRMHDGSGTTTSSTSMGERVLVQPQQTSANQQQQARLRVWITGSVDAAGMSPLDVACVYDAQTAATAATVSDGPLSSSSVASTAKSTASDAAGTRTADGEGIRAGKRADSTIKKSKQQRKESRRVGASRSETSGDDDDGVTVAGVLAAAAGLPLEEACSRWWRLPLGSDREYDPSSALSLTAVSQPRVELSSQVAASGDGGGGGAINDGGSGAAADDSSGGGGWWRTVPQLPRGNSDHPALSKHAAAPHSLSDDLVAEPERDSRSSSASVGHPIATRSDACGIDVVPAAAMTPALFFNSYYRLHKPVIIRGLALDWPQRREWSKAELLARFGNLSFVAGSIPYAREFGIGLATGSGKEGEEDGDDGDDAARRDTHRKGGGGGSNMEALAVTDTETVAASAKSGNRRSRRGASADTMMMTLAEYVAAMDLASAAAAAAATAASHRVVIDEGGGSGNADMPAADRSLPSTRSSSPAPSTEGVAIDAASGGQLGALAAGVVPASPAPASSAAAPRPPPPLYIFNPPSHAQVPSTAEALVADVERVPAFLRHVMAGRQLQGQQQRCSCDGYTDGVDGSGDNGGGDGDRSSISSAQCGSAGRDDDDTAGCGEAPPPSGMIDLVLSPPQPKPQFYLGGRGTGSPIHIHKVRCGDVAYCMM